jgi:predicted Zn finger-like uncharacterized protein
MLIVCPSCATSYMIDGASLGQGGRMVRCARCQATWFAGGPEEEQKQQVSAFVNDVIAEAEAESAEPEPFLRAPAGEPDPPPTVHFGDQRATADFDPAEEQPAPDPIPANGGANSQPAVQGAPDIAPEQHPDAAFAPAEANAAPETGGLAESAEPAAVEDAPSLVPEHAPAEEAEPWHDDDVETFAARRRRMKSRRKQAKRSSRWTAAILVLFAFNVALILGRADVVRYMPQTASLFAAIGLPVNLKQLKFENVRIALNGTAGEGLTVEGTIVSIADKAIKVPDLRFAARNAAGQEIYTWIVRPARRMLDPGGKLSFHSELSSPPADAKDVLVRFVTPQEAAAIQADKAASEEMKANTGAGHGAAGQ